MGGRGQYIGTVNRIPKASSAKIRNSKFGNYLLNPSKDENKAKLFKALGYGMKNSKRLKEDMIEGLKNNKAKFTNKDKYGRTSYQVDMIIGISNKTTIRTVWQKIGNGVPEFVTAYKAR